MSDIKQFLKSRGHIGEYAFWQRPGMNLAVSTTYTPVSVGGIWRVPQTTGVSRLRVKAGDANDSAGGTGAQEVGIYYLDTNLEMHYEKVATAGATASAWTSQDVFRLLCFQISASGTYASVGVDSQAADIVLEDESLNVWGTITSQDFGRSRCQIGAFTTPSVWYNGKTVAAAYLWSWGYSVESNKVVDLNFIQRNNSTQTAAPYSAARTIKELRGLGGGALRYRAEGEIGALMPGTDFGLMARGAATAIVSTEMNFVIAFE